MSDNETILVKEEDFQQIQKKYGELLDVTDFWSGELRDLLPFGAPISQSVWESGFYCEGRNIKYRTSVCSALIPYRSPIFNMFFKCIMLLFLLVAITTSMPFSSWMVILIFYFVAFGDILSNLRNYSLNPDSEINYDARQLTTGRFFRKEISFNDICYMHIYKIRGVDKCTEIIVGAPPHRKNALQRTALVAIFHTWEECYVEIVKDSLQHILGKELKIEYISYSY